MRQGLSVPFGRAGVLVWAAVVAAGGLGVQPALGQWTTSVVNAPRVQYRTFQSAAAGTAVSFHVYTPPAYDTQPQRRFPVLYWLHGSGSATSGIAAVSSWFGGAIARGDLEPMLIVFPNGMPNGMYCDAANGTRPMETVIMQELIPHVDATFRTIAERRGRILEGFSMGGYGTGRLAFKYSERFVAASLLGAGPVQLDFMNPPPGTDVSPAVRAAIYADVWNSDPAIFFSASPWNLAEVNAGAIIASGLRIRLAVGTSDAMLGPNADLRGHLLALNIPHAWQTYPGVGHDPLALLQAMGPGMWDFYREALQPGCDAIDFNNNGVFPEDADVVAFFEVLSGAACATCNDIDFNNNDVFPEDQDVIDFFNVLAGGECS